jgi:hypothetical protein
MMYPNETMETGAGFPALVRFEKNDEGAPLAVFITGGGVFAASPTVIPEGGRPISCAIGSRKQAIRP